MLDLLIVLAFVTYSIIVGIRARRQASRGLSDYFLAGRKLRGWQAGTSMAATQFAADTPLLVAGLVATGGIFMVWRLWVYGIAFVLMAFVFAGHWQRAGVITDAELTEIRYSGRGVLALRVIKALYYGTILNCAILAMVLVAAVGIAEAFLPWHEWLPGAVYGPWRSGLQSTGVTIASALDRIDPATATANNIISLALIVAFTASYSMTGGLRGVVATDVMQFILAMIGTIIFAWVIVREVGGLGGMSDRIVELYGSNRAGQMLSFAPAGASSLFLPFLTIIALQWFFQAASDGTGYLAQRSMACRDQRQARLAGLTFAWLQVGLRSLPWLLIAAGLAIVYPFSAAESAQADFAAGRELTFVRGIGDLLPAGARGLLLTGMLAALASTLDTHMNWGASYWSNDLYKRLVCQRWLRREPAGHELVVVARCSNLIVLGIAVVIMLNLGSIQQAWHLSLLLGAGVGSVLALRWVWERINLWSELSAIVCSIVLAPLVMLGSRAAKSRGWLGDDGLAIEAMELAVMAAGSTAAAVIAAVAGPRTDPGQLQAFYRRVRPVGFWSRTAHGVGERPTAPRRALAGDLVAAAVTTLSLFACLYGAGRLLLPHPQTPAVVPWTALAGGLALVPWWWRRAAARH